MSGGGRGSAPFVACRMIVSWVVSCCVSVVDSPSAPAFVCVCVCVCVFGRVETGLCAKRNRHIFPFSPVHHGGGFAAGLAPLATRVVQASARRRQFRWCGRATERSSPTWGLCQSRGRCRRQRSQLWLSVKRTMM